jgi:hypothetical protein
MKSVLPRKNVALAWLPVGAALVLMGCGGGGGGGTAATTAASSNTGSSTTTPAAPTAPATTSTALKDNAAVPGASFTNFSGGTLTIPVAAVAFAGSRRFVKVARADGATVFLGEVAAGQSFSLRVDAPVGQRAFTYEIFSESADDTIVRGEVTL